MAGPVVACHFADHRAPWQWKCNLSGAASALGQGV